MRAPRLDSDGYREKLIGIQGAKNGKVALAAQGYVWDRLHQGKCASLMCMQNCGPQTTFSPALEQHGCLRWPWKIAALILFGSLGSYAFLDRRRPAADSHAFWDVRRPALVRARRCCNTHLTTPNTNGGISPPPVAMRVWHLRWPRILIGLDLIGFFARRFWPDTLSQGLLLSEQQHISSRDVRRAYVLGEDVRWTAAAREGAT